MLVSDIYMPAEKTHYLQQTDTISDYQRLSEETQHSRFPVVNRHHRLMGIVTAKDVLGNRQTRSSIGDDERTNQCKENNEYCLC